MCTAGCLHRPGCEAAPRAGPYCPYGYSPCFQRRGRDAVFHENYDGGDVPLPKGGRTIRVQDFPDMEALRGRTLITADGSTLLGADDKAGIAEIMTLLEVLAATGAPHGRLCIAFTPDEEIGRGADRFDVQKFGAKYAYTMDGGRRGRRGVRELQCGCGPLRHHRRLGAPRARPRA